MPDNTMDTPIGSKRKTIKKDHQEISTRPKGMDLPTVADMEFLKKYDLFRCESCAEYSIFRSGRLVYPENSDIPDPVDSLPNDVVREYNEAALVIDDSPRAAAALLRLALEKLVEHLDADGDTLNQKIGDLVGEGHVSPRIQKALDTVRVVGNESVHPGVMDMQDDYDTARALFKLINVISEETIGRDVMIDQLYEHLPENKRQGIENRDNQ